MLKIFVIIFFLLFFYQHAEAYIGIGPLIPLIGNAIVFIFLALVGVMGFIIYPFRKIYSHIKNKKKNIPPKKNK